MLEWVKIVGPIFASWPVVALIAVIILRNPLRAVVARLAVDDFTVEFAKLKAAVKHVTVRIDQLYALSMSEEAFINLKKIADNNFKNYWLDPELKVGLALELGYFKMVGYIRLDQDPNVPDIRYIPTGNHPEGDICRYVRITPQGQEFVALRECAMEPAFKRP